jgi:hypothetical protein
MHKIKSYEADDQILYLTDVRGTESEISRDEFEEYLRASGAMLRPMIYRCDEEEIEARYELVKEEYWAHATEREILSDINEFLSLREVASAFDIQPALRRILHNVPLIVSFIFLLSSCAVEKTRRPQEVTIRTTATSTGFYYKHYARDKHTGMVTQWYDSSKSVKQ